MHETERGSVQGPGTEQKGSGWKEQASSTAKDLASQAEAVAETGKDQVASRVGEVAHAVRRAGQEDEKLSPYAEAIGSQLEDVADFIQHHDLRDMLRSAGEFAHRQPALFLGGAFTIGLIAARFLKSSSEEHDYWPPPRYREHYPRSDAYDAPGRPSYGAHQGSGETGTRSPTGAGAF